MENNPTIKVRDGEELDITVIDKCLKENIEGLEGTPEVSQYPSGNSNLTYAVNYPNRPLVLRRPPLGTKPKSGHSMHREYRIMTALAGHYPVPSTPYYVSDEDSPIGAEFYVMDKVEGVLVKQEIPTEWNFTNSDRKKWSLAFFDQLVALHQIDYKAVGLEDFGRPVGYIERQVSGWNGRFEKAHTPDVPDLIDVREWLAAKMPAVESGHAILHGDFRIDNMMLNPADPFDVVTVLDWEISALGDPLMDVANTLGYWIQADDHPGLQAMVMQPSNVEGMATREELLQHYADKTGANIDRFDFYMVYGYFRQAAILQQIYFRFYNGQTSDKRFGKFAQAVQVLGEVCRQLIAKSSL
jgi:aminoglycoside phosphotransferase (APT) family kinase protein